MKNLLISAAHVEIDTESNETFLVELQVSNYEYERVLAQYSTEEIVNTVGTRELLEHMDVDDIMSYMNDMGIKTEWEDEE